MGSDCFGSFFAYFLFFISFLYTLYGKVSENNSVVDIELSFLFCFLNSHNRRLTKISQQLKCFTSDTIDVYTPEISAL